MLPANRSTWRVTTARLAVLVVFAFALVGCAKARPGAAIAEKIRTANSPIVREVFFSPFNQTEGSPEFIVVYLTDDATEAQAMDLWCTVIIPAGAEQMAVPGVQLEQGTRPGPGGGLVGGHPVLTDKPTCPGDASATTTG